MSSDYDEEYNIMDGEIIELREEVERLRAFSRELVKALDELFVSTSPFVGNLDRLLARAANRTGHSSGVQVGGLGGGGGGSGNLPPNKAVPVYDGDKLIGWHEPGSSWGKATPAAKEPRQPPAGS